MINKKTIDENEIRSILISNIDKLHTTVLGEARIKKNLNYSDNNIIDYLKNKILCKDNHIYKKGKNYYCEIYDIIITINSYDYCVITAHQKKR